MSAHLSPADCADLLACFRSGQMTPAQWVAHLRAHPELVRFCESVERRERADDEYISGVLRRAGFNVT